MYELQREPVVPGSLLRAGQAFWAAARFKAQRFLVASLIAFRPAALSFLFPLAGAPAAGDGADFFTLAHLAFCAAAIFRRPAALMLRLRVGGLEAATASMGSPWSRCRSSAICESSRLF